MLASLGSVASSGERPIFIVTIADPYSYNPKAQIRNVADGTIIRTIALTDGSFAASIAIPHIPKDSFNMYYAESNRYELWVINLLTGMKRKVCSWFSPSVNPYISESRDFAILGVYFSKYIHKVKLSTGESMSMLGSTNVSTGIILGFYQDDKHLLTIPTWPDEQSDPRPVKVDVDNFLYSKPNYVYSSMIGYGLDANGRLWFYMNQNTQWVMDENGNKVFEVSTTDTESSMKRGLGSDISRKRMISQYRSSDNKQLYLRIRNVDNPIIASDYLIGMCYSSYYGENLQSFSSIIDLSIGENVYLLTLRATNTSGTSVNFVVCMNAENLAVLWVINMGVMNGNDAQIAVSNPINR